MQLRKGLEKAAEHLQKYQHHGRLDELLQLNDVLLRCVELIDTGAHKISKRLQHFRGRISQARNAFFDQAAKYKYMPEDAVTSQLTSGGGR